MKKLSILVSAALFSGTLALSSAPAYANLPLAVGGQTMPSLAPMLEQATPAVVSISVKGTHEIEQRVPDAFKFFFGNPRQARPQERPFRALGSGVIIDAGKGYIVTNNHVVDEADEIVVTLKDGRQIEAKKLGSDKASDIALLQIDAEDLTEIKLADSDDLRIGDFTVAIGNPFGLGQTVTSGIVSALGRSGLNLENYEDFIQTDAAINSGNSGGALVNLRGELIGINTAIIGPNGGNVGIGFAIPSNMMNNLAKQIIEFGEVRRGILGVSGRSVNGDIAKAMELETNQGGFVEQVTTGSAAEEAGIMAGDVITKVNGKAVKTFQELKGKIGSIGAGKKVKITVIRGDGDEKEFTVKLKKSETANVEAASIHRMLEGAELENNTEGSGVLVKGLEQDSPAQIIGLKSGDIINGINRKRIKNIAELRNYLKNPKGVMALNVIRGNSQLYLMIR
ncbi:Do family serine endopeptidase [Thalassomonas haliotis]|uniref:Do family serine endopeptidase n=1 Tax=Thalassomonas haliotis TaxID=485448 RepID=A0ABY7VFU3_9GAMM|nr:Do family serine endopeptidase [Thalassomonas haliotis]WDE12589.1 Do family serine endopeptidase [Thalassomonas haliotis]